MYTENQMRNLHKFGNKTIEFNKFSFQKRNIMNEANFSF